jgi:hypothetical protein
VDLSKVLALVGQQQYAFVTRFLIEPLDRELSKKQTNSE